MVNLPSFLRFDARLLNEWLAKVIVCIRNRNGVLKGKK